MIENMIYGNSSDPVELKRVSLKVWTLKDEILFALQSRIDKSEDHSKIDISDIKAFYIKNPMDMGAAKVVAEEQNPAEQLDDSEDEMAKAMAEAEAGAEPEETPATEEPSTEGETTTPATEGAENNSTEEKAAEQATTAATPEIATYQRVWPPVECRVTGFSLLGDINMEGILFFAKQKFMPGQVIVIHVDIPHGFSLTAEVIKTFDYESKSKVISETRPGHRVQAKFVYNFTGERTNLRKFLESVIPTKPTSKTDSTEEAPSAEQE